MSDNVPTIDTVKYMEELKTQIKEHNIDTMLLGVKALGVEAEAIASVDWEDHGMSVYLTIALKINGEKIKLKECLDGLISKDTKHLRDRYEFDNLYEPIKKLLSKGISDYIASKIQSDVIRSIMKP